MMKIFTYGIIAIVAAAIITGFFVVGSPGTARLRQFDNRRESDLGMIQSEITYYWQSKRVLPEALENLRDDIRGIAIPMDPETGVAYEYRVLKEMTFELCATFTLPTSSENLASGGRDKAMAVPASPVVPGNPSWAHGVGRTCFERTIDPAFFPPINKN